MTSKKDVLQLISSDSNPEDDPSKSHVRQLGMDNLPPTIIVNGKTVNNGYAHQAKRITTLGESPKTSISKNSKDISKGKRTSASTTLKPKTKSK
jgi:hypothetical protein